jgi:hyaluronate lyase
MATNYYVENANQFNSTVDKNGANFSTLKAGDRVYLKGGHWNGLITTLTGSLSDAQAQANPAMILACDTSYNPTPGGVIVDGLSAIVFQGTGISFCGVTFSPLSGMQKAGLYNDYSGNDTIAYLLRLYPGSRFMTISHVKFDNCGRDTVDYANNDHYGAWIYAHGYHHTIQYCEMSGRDFDPNDINVADPTLRKSFRQATVVIYKDDVADQQYGYHWIHHNYFGPRKIPKSGDPRLPTAADGSVAADNSNGWECIRNGSSSYVDVDFNNTIEKNTFYQAIQSVDFQAVASVTVSNQGSGYTSAPIVSFSGGGGSGAVATATVSAGKIIGVIMISGGSGYTSAPTVSFSGGGGATGTAVIGGPDDNTGEPEMISNKSRRNTYRYNTILNNYGQLCLRQGDYCVVQGNYFLSGGVYDINGNVVLTETQNNQMGGVRAFGFGHVIANNYFYKLNGDGIRSALILGSGATATGTLTGLTNGSNGAAYETVNYAQVIGNSFIDCKVLTLDNPNSELYPVYGTQFFNNLIYYSSNISGSGLIGNSNADYGSPLLRDHGGRAAGNHVYSATASQLGSATALLGSTWLSDNFESYSAGATPNSTTSPQLVSAGYTAVASGNSGKMARYYKTTTSGGGYLQYSLSSGNSTARPKGFISFKIQQNANAAVGTANQLYFRVGQNDTGNLSSNANAFIDLRFSQDSLGTLKIYSVNVQTGTDQTIGSTGIQSVKIWYNNTTSAMGYVDPSGGSQTLAAKSYVVFVGGVLKTPSASGSTLNTPTGATLDIGKIAFQTGSTGQADFSVDDILAGDTDNTISSASKDSPLMSGIYDVLTVPASNSPLLGRASGLPAVNDTSASVSSTGTPFDLAGTVATYGALDMRGLSRPSTGGDIGNYEVEVSGLGNRPLRRTEVGVVAATYPNAIQVNSIAQGVSFSQQLSASFGTGAVAWSCFGSLPSGISLSSSGLLSGTTTSSGAFPVVLRLTDANGSYAEISTSLNVVAPVVAPVISSSATASGQKGTAFSYTITASGSPISYSAPNLPTGLSLNTSTGAITGTPTMGGTFSVTISATNAGGTGYATLTLSFTDEFDALRLKWRTTLIDDVKSSKTVDSINTRSSGYQTTMLYALTGVKVVNGGSGYTSVPTVAISGGGGTGATATATIAAGKVSAITVTSVGSGYRTTPTITVSGGGGSGVSAIPIVAIWSDLPPAAQTGVTADVASGNIADCFKRLEYMAQAYAIPGCALYQDPTLLAAITGGLDWLTSNVYTSTGTMFANWYDWEIAAPQSLNNAAILLLSNPSALTSVQIANYVKAVYNFGPNSVNFKDYFWWGALTGANTSNVALTTAVQGILLGNNTTTVTRFWHNTAGHPVNPQTDYVVSGRLLLEEAQGNLSGNNPLDWSGDSVFTPVTSGDGWYADGSFIFHYNIPYTGSYGQELMDNISILVKLLDGSTWEITDSGLSNIYGWITNGFAPLMYRGAMMDMVRGRAIASSSSNESKVGDAVIKTIRSVATFAPADIATQLLAFADSPQVAPGQYHFASMDRVVAHRSGFSFGLSMSSTRVGEYEINTTSPTNLKGWYTGAGVTYLYLGNPDTQYMDSYWATVDWYHLPGTTADLSATPDYAVTDQSWVGGAQVGKAYGVAGMSEHPAGTELYAKKSWFMLDDEIVCLGTGITCTSGGQVDTTVENRKLGKTGTTTFNIADTAYSLAAPTTWANPVTVSTGTSPTWCALEGVAGYYFPNGASDLQAQFTSDSGAWTTINPTDSDSVTYTDYYLKLLFKHGVNPTAAKYAYVILPNRTVSSVKAYATNPDVAILSNTEPTSTTAGIQAVKSQILGVVAANFWAKTSGPDNGGTADIITVNKQCSVIVKETYNNISIGVADPTQSATGTITVTLNGRASLATLSADSGLNVTGNNPITLSVNVSGSKGKSFNASFSMSPAPQITSNLNMVGVIGSPVSYQIASDASGVTYGATGLPRGLNVNTTTGSITGTPTESGMFTATVSATNGSGRAGYATLTIQVGASLSNLSSTFGASTTWVCPANVTAVQVECWGAGGAGGSASKPVSGNAFGGGGAGGSYAKKNSVSVVPGASYTISIGAGGVSAISPSLTSVSGGDSSFGSGSSASCLAKGGAGGQTVISSGSGIVGSGGVGNSAGSLGDVVFAGGNGLVGQGSPTNTGGGGGGSAGKLSVGGNATSYVGAAAVSGGGAGGDGKDSSGNGNGLPGGSPGGGGGGARGSSVGSQALGGTGGAGQVVLTVVGIAKVSQTITFGLDPATAKVGDAARTLIATSSAAGLEVTLTSSDSRVATITGGNTLNIVGVGTTTITAKQAGNSNYEAATDVSVVLTVSAASGTTYASYLSDNNLPAGTAFDAKVNGVAVGLKYAFGSASGMPQNNGEAAVPVMSGNQLTYIFDVKDDSALTIKYQTSTDLVTWTTAQDVSPGAGAAPAGFLKRQVVVTGSDKLFVRINVTR